MKKVKITTIFYMTDEFFEGDEVQELKNDILSGKHQKELKTKDSVSKVTMTFEVIK